MNSLNSEKPLLHAMAYTFLSASSFCSCCTFYKQQKHLSIGIIPFVLCLITGLLGMWIYSKYRTFFLNFILIQSFKELHWVKTKCFNWYDYIVPAQMVIRKYGTTSNTIIKFFKTIKFLTNIYTLPLVIGDMYLKYELSIDLVIAHMFLPILGLVPCGVIECENLSSSFTIRDKTIIPKYKLQSAKLKFKQYVDSMDFVTFVSTISLSILSCLGNNMFGVFAAIIYALTYFVITEKGQIGNSIPAEPFHVIGMGVFCGLGMKALTTFYSADITTCIINK